MSVYAKMTAIADEIRELSGETDKLGLDAMATKTGEANAEVATQGELISQIANALQGKMKEDSDNLILQNKVVDPSLIVQIVTADAGYNGLSQVTVKAMPTAMQATPSITIDSNGLITATTTQNSGYVSAGVKSATKQLVIKGATTFTPTTTSQIAVNAGTYVTGDIVVGAIEGSGSGTGDTNAMFEQILNRSFTEASHNTISSIGNYAFATCHQLISVSFPAATTIGVYAFNNCTKLSIASFPLAITIGAQAFMGCRSLTTVNFPEANTIDTQTFANCIGLEEVNFPKVTKLGNYAFAGCSKLSVAIFPKASSIGVQAFSKCYNLSSLTLGSLSVCALSNSNAFSSTPYAGYKASFSGTPYIYVPSSLVSAYQNTANWSYFSSYFSAIENMEV